jgi:hypothetical protein
MCADARLAALTRAARPKVNMVDCGFGSVVVVCGDLATDEMDMRKLVLDLNG